MARIRDAAEAEGLLGRSLYVEKGPAAPLPFADRLVDLLVVSDLRDADLTPELRSEWLRVLAPRRGTALVGRAKAAGDGLSQEALKTWTKDLPLAKVADDSGVWALLRTELPAGSDPWTHRCHGPDNTQVSSDTTLKPPFLTQWWGMPRQEGFWGTTVVAGNGRMFSMRSSRNSGEPGLPHRAQPDQRRRALAAAPAAGARDGAKSRTAATSRAAPALVVADDSLFLVDRDGVLSPGRRDRGASAAASPGRSRAGRSSGSPARGGLLAVLAGDADVVTPIAYQTIADNPTGRDLAVYDAQSSRLLWHDTLAGDVDERLIVVRDEPLYCLAQGVGMVCRELRTGKTVWTNPDPDLQAEFRTPESKVVANCSSPSRPCWPSTTCCCCRPSGPRTPPRFPAPTASSSGRSRLRRVVPRPDGPGRQRPVDRRRPRRWT